MIIWIIIFITYPFLRSYNDDESDNNSLFHSYNNCDNNIFEPVDAQKHDDLIDPQSFSYNNCNYGFQKEENNIFEDFQKISKENNQTFKKSIGNKSTGLSEMNDKTQENIAMDFYNAGMKNEKIIKNYKK